jgi:hypothetical protein
MTKLPCAKELEEDRPQYDSVWSKEKGENVWFHPFFLFVYARGLWIVCTLVLSHLFK